MKKEKLIKDIKNVMENGEIGSFGYELLYDIVEKINKNKYESKELVEQVAMLENKLEIAKDHLDGHGLSRDEAVMTLDKDSFIDWAIDMEKISSKDIVVIDQEQVAEFSAEWDAAHKEEE